MFDETLAFVQWLQAASGITALVPSAQVVAGELPQGANPDLGQKWITVYSRGGLPHPEIRDLPRPSFGVTCWSQRGDHKGARQVYRAIVDRVYSTLNITVSECVIVCAEIEVPGQDTNDPATGWACCVAFFSVLMRPKP